MKNFIILLLLVFSFSCTSMLDQVDPTGPTGDDFFSTEQELGAAVTSVYAGLSIGTGLYGGIMTGFEMMADNIYTGSSTTDGSVGPWTNFSHDPSNAGVRRMYEELYITITRANQVITNAEKVEGVSEANLKNYLGQAFFLRGFSYFLLTLMYGDVPIILEPVLDPTGAFIAKSSAADVYAQAIADIQIAERDLPEVQSDKGRITSLIAKAMLGKVYLFGGDELNNNAWYGQAQQKFREVIQSGRFSLYNDPNKTPMENLMDIYSLANQNTVGKEEVFAIQSFNSGGAWSDGDVGTEIPMQYNARQNRGLNLWGYGWGYVYEAVDKIWEDGDARKDFNLWFQGEDVIIDGNLRGKYDQTRQQRPNAKPKGLCLQKFWYAENFKTVNGRSTQHMPVIRYADVLLMYAEADLMADGSISAEGLAAFNQVRNRAGLASLDAGQLDRARILHERRVELFGEMHRWFDLMRTRTAEQAFAAIIAGDTDGDDTEKLGFTPARHYKLPLPQTALDRNPELVQTPAWAAAE